MTQFNPGFNSNDATIYAILTNNNLTLTGNGAGYGASRAKLGRQSGKGYFELVTDAGWIVGNAVSLYGGVADSVVDMTKQPIFGGGGGSSAMWRGNSQYGNQGGYIGAGGNTPFGANGGPNTLGCAVNIDARTVDFYANGVLNVAGVPFAAPNNGSVFPFASVFFAPPETFSLKVLASEFSYAIPAGYAEWGGGTVPSKAQLMRVLNHSRLIK